MGTPASLSKSEAVYQRLRVRILDGTYSSGFRLVLGQVAKEFGVSPVPVREAVRRLEAEGLVTFIRNVGAEVAGINTSDYADAMQTLAVLEGMATALAAGRLTKQDIAKANEINEEMREMLGERFDPVRFTDLNHQFHEVLCATCPNRHLHDLLQREWERIALIRRSSFTFVPGRSRASVEEHDALLALIRSGAEPGEIEMVARRHKLRTMEQFLARRSEQS
ncbi:GntR family transcriptional regulator [Micromonospora sonneratiae]|uniref:GntR family transcriptional regulator n=1 Tax=Micromonospora sonneratiae TaxID=1184706 RepID=A0ABW3Y819_9ACTN